MSNPFTRREALAKMWKAGLGLVGAAAAWTSWDVLRPGAVAGFGGKIKAGKSNLVPDDNVLLVTEAHGYLAVINEEITAMSWVCPHLGCRVPFCESSGQFECPCHGTIYNRAGDWQSGPSPRGLDKFEFEVKDGTVIIDTGAIIKGPSKGTKTIDEPQKGPRCEGAEA